MISSLKNFVMKGGGKLAELAANPAKIKALRATTREVKTGFKGARWLFGGESKPNFSTVPATTGYSGTVSVDPQYQIPVPKDAYMAYQGTPLKNIRPYTDAVIS